MYSSSAVKMISISSESSKFPYLLFYMILLAFPIVFFRKKFANNQVKIELNYSCNISQVALSNLF